MKLVETDADATQQQLQLIVNQWCADNQQSVMPVIMHDRVFDEYFQAVDWLRLQSEDAYHAVRYHDEYGNEQRDPSKQETRLNRELKQLRSKLEARNIPYWAGHVDDTDNGMVTCSHCQSMLNITYCGVRKGWRNHCPVCHADLRPAPVIKQFNQWKNEYVTLRDKRDQLRYERQHPTYWLTLLIRDDPSRQRIHYQKTGAL